MSKRETIERIMARNPSAQAEFLAEFSIEDLGAYLRQLESLGKRPGLTGASVAASSPAARSPASAHPYLAG